MSLQTDLRFLLNKAPRLGIFMMIMASQVSCSSTSTDLISIDLNSMDPLADWSRDPRTLQTQCLQNKTALQTTCWIQLAALHGQNGDEGQGIAACAEIAKMPLSQSQPETQQVWEWECAFRLGEELATAGYLDAGLRHCSMAGRFAQNCITHAIWRAPLRTTARLKEADSIPPNQSKMTKVGQTGTELNSRISTSKLWGLAQQQHKSALQQLQTLSPQLQQDAHNQLLARFGLSLYVGTGVAYPEPAHLTDHWGSSLRTGYAFERIGIATASKSRWSEMEIQALFETIVEDWSKNHPTQADTSVRLTDGRVYLAKLSPMDEQKPSQVLYGGGRRLVHESPQIDLQIALLEALFWYPHTPVHWFTTWFDHPEESLQSTSAKLYCLANGLRSNHSLGSHSPAVMWYLQNCPLQ